MRFCCTVSHGKIEPCCEIKIPFGFGPARGLPSMRIEPASGCRNPATMFIRVVLPQPEGPTMATNSPSATVRLTSSTTCSDAPFEAKPLRMPLTAILVAIAPPYRFQALEQPHQSVEHQTDQADDDHSRNHQIVAVAGVA